ncbi:hypothetical protein THIOM_005437 [Candidatus Thiomargarita nelsonii]|uniref:Uncharacterized protein n=1 Tax=Candidatus Thiomargarita nelsonii TaxID=1003181 RepID=A0A0A6RKJ9_9GAMM|nr:hypothetical protein THIOM_005437 [Candidatus Thiomargarita nelsonii]
MLEAIARIYGKDEWETLRGHIVAYLRQLGEKSKTLSKINFTLCATFMINLLCCKNVQPKFFQKTWFLCGFKNVKIFMCTYLSD